MRKKLTFVETNYHPELGWSTEEKSFTSHRARMNLEAILRTVIHARSPEGHRGLPLLLKGGPGSRKTSLLKQFGRKYGLPVLILISSLREPSDFLGLPVFQAATVEDVVGKNVKQKDGSVVYVPPAWARTAAKLGDCIIVLDEITSCPPAVQHALLRVVQERVVGDLQLPSGVRFIALCNPASRIMGGHELTPPLSNRFGHIDLMVRGSDGTLTIGEQDKQDWVAFVRNRKKYEDPEQAEDPQEIQKVFDELFPAAYDAQAAIVSAYINSRDPSTLYCEPSPDNEQASAAFPTLRTWDFVIHALAAAEICELDVESENTLIQSFVGEDAALEFGEYRQKLDLPDPKAWLEGTTQWEPGRGRIDQVDAVLASAIPYVDNLKGKKRPKGADLLFKKIQELVTNGYSDIVEGYMANDIQERRLSADVSQKVLDETYKLLYPIKKAVGDV